MDRRAGKELENKVTWATIAHLADKAGWTPAEEWRAKEAAETADKSQAAHDTVDKLKASGKIDAADAAALEAVLLPGFAPFDPGTLTAGVAAPKIEANVFEWKEPKKLLPRPFLGHDKHYCRKYLSVTIGRSGDGKSSYGLAEAVSLAIGRDLLKDARAFKHRPLVVWYWNLEDPEEEIQKRATAIMMHYKVRPEELGDRLLINSGRDQRLVIASKQGNTKILTPVVGSLKDEMKRKHVSVLIVDPFIKTHELAENDNGDVN